VTVTGGTPRQPIEGDSRTVFIDCDTGGTTVKDMPEGDSKGMHSLGALEFASYTV